MSDKKSISPSTSPLAHIHEIQNRWQERLYNLVDAFFDDVFDHTLYDKDLFPKIDLEDKNDHYLIRAELPGVDPHQIEIFIQDHLLTISGKKLEQADHRQQRLKIAEIHYGEFSRTISLPSLVETPSSKAIYHNFLLTITLKKRKSESLQSNRIPIELK